MISGFDIVAGIFIVVVAALGVRAGFLGSFLGIFSVYLAAYLAARFSIVAAQNFSLLGTQTSLAYSVMFIFIFFGIYLVAEFVIWIFKKIVSVKLLGIMDSVAAALLSGFKALLIIGIVLELMVNSPLASSIEKTLKTSYIKDSAIKTVEITYPYAHKVFPKLEKLVGKKLKESDLQEKTKDITLDLYLKAKEVVSKEVNGE